MDGKLTWIDDLPKKCWYVPYTVASLPGGTITWGNTYFCTSRNVPLLWPRIPYFSMPFYTFLNEFGSCYLRCWYDFKLQHASIELLMLMSMEQPSCPSSVASLPSSCAPDIRAITEFCCSHLVLWTSLIRFWTWNHEFSNLENDPRSFRTSIPSITYNNHFMWFGTFGHATSSTKLQVPSITPPKWLGAASGVDLTADDPWYALHSWDILPRGTSHSWEAWRIQTSMHHVSACISTNCRHGCWFDHLTCNRRISAYLPQASIIHSIEIGLI